MPVAISLCGDVMLVSDLTYIVFVKTFVQGVPKVLLHPFSGEELGRTTGDMCRLNHHHGPVIQWSWAYWGHWMTFGTSWNFSHWPKNSRYFIQTSLMGMIFVYIYCVVISYLIVQRYDDAISVFVCPHFIYQLYLYLNGCFCELCHVTAVLNVSVNTFWLFCYSLKGIFIETCKNFYFRFFIKNIFSRTNGALWHLYNHEPFAKCSPNIIEVDC